MSPQDAARAPRLLCTVSSGRVGGAEYHTLLLAERLRAEHGWEVEVACREGALVPRLEAARIPVHRLRFGDGPDLVTPLRLAWLARGYDLLHAHMNRAALYTRGACLLARRPWVATAHGMTRGVYYRGADRVIAVSRAVEEHLAAQGVGRLVTVLNGLPEPDAADPDEVSATRAEAGAGPADRLLLVLANRHPNKGQELALECLAALPTSYRLLLSGHGMDDPALTARTRELGVADRAHLRGPWEGTAVPFEAADLVLVPSRREAFSLVAAEARMRGVPVVVADVDGLVEVVPDEAPGCRRVAGRDPEDWAAAVRALAEDPGARDAARRAAAAVGAELSLDGSVRATLAVYEQVLSGR